LPNELILEICIPRQKININFFVYYRKVGERNAQAISKVLLAARLEFWPSQTIKDIRIVYGSVMPYTYRMKKLEQHLLNQHITPQLIAEAVHWVGHDLKPIDDIRSNAKYRRKVAQNLMEEFLTQAQANVVFSEGK